MKKINIKKKNKMNNLHNKSLDLIKDYKTFIIKLKQNLLQIVEFINSIKDNNKTFNEISIELDKLVNYLELSGDLNFNKTYTANN